MYPSTYVRTAVKRALRRRYAYAALRTLRKALARALARHWTLTFGERPYAGSGELERVGTAYARALAAVRRRWPGLDLEDPRGRV
jgi:hypothetical protein